MKIIRRIKELKSEISNINNLGFVPTMGCFHKGHLSLMKKSINKSSKTLVSIYVNPTQFNKKKDNIQGVTKKKTQYKMCFQKKMHFLNAVSKKEKIAQKK